MVTFASHSPKVVGCCAFVSLLFLILAAFVPSYVTTTLTSEGKLNIDKVDIGIGDGMYIRNWCFGEKRPEESTMSKFGLSCQGSWQTEYCQDDNLNSKEKKHCKDFHRIQALQVAAMLFVLIAGVLNVVTESYDTQLRVEVKTMICFAALLIALIMAVMAMDKLKHSDMVKREHGFGCSNIMGSSELCYGYGGAYTFQWLAIVTMSISLIVLVGFMGLLCSNTDSGSELRASLV